MLGMVASAQANRPPSTVFIVADDLGWADTTPDGSPFHETTNIQRLASSGVRFVNAPTTSPVCASARASLRTRLYAERLGMTQPALSHSAGVDWGYDRKAGQTLGKRYS